MLRKLLFAVSVVLLPVVGYAVTAPVFDNASTNNGTASVFVQSHTCNGINRFLLIEIGYDPTTADPVTLVTYNGTTATELFNLESASEGLYVYYVLDPNPGAHPVSIFLSASVKCAIGVRSYTGVCQATPLGNSSGVTVNAASGAVTVTTTEDDSLVLGTAAWEGSGIITEDVSQTERYTVLATLGTVISRTKMLGDDEGKAVAGAVVMSYGYTASNPGVIHAVELHPPCPEDTPTATPTITNTPAVTPTPVYQDYKRLIWKGHPVTFAEGTASLLHLENNVVDATGLEDNWINTGPAPFNGTTYKVGSYSAGPFAIAESITNTVVATIKTVEMYALVFTGGDFADDRAWETSDGGVQMNLRFDRVGGQVSTRIYSNGWSGTYNLSTNVWYHFGLILDDGSDVYLYIDNTERLTLATNNSPSDTLHYLGCGLNNGNVFQYGLIDEVRLSTDAKTSFPTED